MPAITNVGAYEDARADALALQDKLFKLSEQVPRETMLEDRLHRAILRTANVIAELDAVLS